MADYTVHFIPADLRVRAEQGDNLLRIALESGVHINASCGGDGSCGKCRVRIADGSVTADSSAQLTAEDIAQGWRLACRSSVETDITVEIPRSLSHTSVRVREIHASRYAIKPEDPAVVDPPVQLISLRLDPATASDNCSDYTRLERKLRKEHALAVSGIELAALQSLPALLRKADGNVQVLIAESRILQVVPCDMPCIAASFDIGTTSLWAQAIDMRSGAVLAESSAYNPQIACGDDVIARIMYSQKPGGLERLQQILVQGLAKLLDELLEKSGKGSEAISHITAAGNTVMTHLLLGIDPKYLRESPYVPAVAIVPPLRAFETGFAVRPSALLYVLPCIASYVGGDIVSGVVACGMHASEKRTLYMDLGTNGEIVLGNRDWLMTASCSAGPAFEGGGLACGMRAMPGAIEGFSLSEDCEPMLLTIDRAKPLGICGSGAINILAGFMQARIVSSNGRFDRGHAAAGRMRQGSAGPEFVLVEKAYSATGEDIVLTEADIENIMRAKAAMFAGCHALLENANLSFRDIEQVIIAGAFGDYIDLENAIAIGLFPDIPRERYSFFGNGSLHGARLAACSTKFLEAARETARRMTNIELSEDRSFMDKYIAGMFLPHTDSSLFPSVTSRPAEGRPNRE